MNKEYPVYCAWCKDKIVNYSEVKNSHGCCDDCKEKMLTQWVEDLAKITGGLNDLTESN